MTLLKIYNTIHRQIDEFIPYQEKKVNMYTCGPTVYNYAHIGNLRTYISEDVLDKTLRYLGYEVTRCMNITDVGHLVGDGDIGEDKMAVAVKREKKSALEIASYYTEAFFQDFQSLHCKMPDIVAKATDHIQEYIHIISSLLDSGYAYIQNGNVYFDTTKFSHYYELSGLVKEDLKIAVRTDIEEDQNKKNPLDFGLWFTNSKFQNQELKWDSPWGVGYPGWHIECSGIAMKYLGEYLDIHCGAIDAIFPHHSNEIAQSECYMGHKWCNYWVHMEFLNDATGKMSKSKGEFLTLRSLKEKGYEPSVYRMFCLQSHYRNPLTFTYEALDNVKNAYYKLKNKVQSLQENIDEKLDVEQVSMYQKQFIQAIENDLNTASALTVLYDVLKSDLNQVSKLYLVKDFEKVLSLGLFDSFEEVDLALQSYIEQAIQRRCDAKAKKDFALADQIRFELLERGVLLQDTKDGTTYEIKR